MIVCLFTGLLGEINSLVMEKLSQKIWGIKSFLPMKYQGKNYTLNVGVLLLLFSKLFTCFLTQLQKP